MTAPLAGIPIPAINPATGKLYPDDIPGDAPAVTAQIANALAGFTPAVSSTHTPYYHYAVNGTYPGRPVTDQPVVWADPLVAVPAVAGSTTAGTGPAPIDTILYATGVGV